MLKENFGDKKGNTLHENSKGIDDTLLQTQHVWAFSYILFLLFFFLFFLFLLFFALLLLVVIYILTFQRRESLSVHKFHGVSDLLIWIKYEILRLISSLPLSPSPTLSSPPLPLSFTLLSLPSSLFSVVSSHRFCRLQSFFVMWVWRWQQEWKRLEE